MAFQILMHFCYLETYSSEYKLTSHNCTKLVRLSRPQLVMGMMFNRTVVFSSYVS